MFIGGVLRLLGIGIFIDGINGTAYFSLQFFGTSLLLESLVTLSVASSGVSAQKQCFILKAVFCFVVILVLSNKPYGNLLLAIIFGFAYFIIGLFVIASAWIMRYSHWKNALLSGVA